MGADVDGDAKTAELAFGVVVYLAVLIGGEEPAVGTELPRHPLHGAGEDGLLVAIRALDAAAAAATLNVGLHIS